MIGCSELNIGWCVLEGWCSNREGEIVLCPLLFHLSLVTVVVGRKNVSTSFLKSHTGPGMHQRLQWFVMQSTCSGSRGLLCLQIGIEVAGRAEGPGGIGPGLVLLLPQ